MTGKLKRGVRESYWHGGVVAWRGKKKSTKLLALEKYLENKNVVEEAAVGCKPHLQSAELTKVK